MQFSHHEPPAPSAQLDGSGKSWLVLHNSPIPLNQRTAQDFPDYWESRRSFNAHNYHRRMNIAARSFAA